MPTGQAPLLTAAATLLGLLPLAIAHGDGSDGTDGSPAVQDAPGRPMIADGAQEVQNDPQSYFALSEHAGAIYAHIFLMILAWVVILPIGIMFSISKSRFTLLVQFLFLVANAAGLLVGTIYNSHTPDLYENNSHHKAGWVITWIACAWVLMSLLNLYTGRKNPAEKSAAQRPPLTSAAMAQYSPFRDGPSHKYSWSGDSGQGTEPNTASLIGSPRSMSQQSESLQFSEMRSPFQPLRFDEEKDEQDADNEDADEERRGFLRNTRVDGFLKQKIPKVAMGRTWSVLQGMFVAVERTLLLLGFVALTTGMATFGGVFRGSAVFNGLAHFIKGGIFFWYGLLTLGRWMGCFADFGWAWNIKPTKEMVGRWKSSLPSAECVESFVIFLYGTSNVFLEHLAAWGDEWTAQDLEHVSITIMFFGGGLLGMLIESHKIREFLNTNILANQQDNAHEHGSEWNQPKTYRFPMNPLPGLIILLLGIMMSSHHQESMVSTMIHSQWGSLFVGFALARAVTYIITYIAPPTSYLPSRPPSELVSSFCLVSGGILFMASNKDTVAALEQYDLDAMFIFTVTMGLTALIMAWTAIIVALKGWAYRRENRSQFSFPHRQLSGSTA
ncbi:MAG: hypothetical protein M1820_001565 [Bogoriella megaspora]|nr:MAG: hypothetical protein M1820_001565 [Bogoriella megaspora]